MQIQPFKRLKDEVEERAAKEKPNSKLTMSREYKNSLGKLNQLNNKIFQTTFTCYFSQCKGTKYKS